MTIKTGTGIFRKHNYHERGKKLLSNNKNVCCIDFVLWGHSRVMFAVLSLVLLSACQTTFDVVPKPSTTFQTTALSIDPPITVKGAEAFDRTINPVTFSYSVIDFNLRFSESAAQIIAVQLREKLGPTKLSGLKSVTVSVDEAMIRTMNISDASFAHRFDVEARIGLTAESTSSSGALEMHSATAQSVHTGGVTEESITCDLGKEQLERSLPILLERAVDALAAEMI